MNYLAEAMLTEEELAELLRDLPQIVIDLETSRDYANSAE